MRNITEGTDEKLAEWKAYVVLSLDLKREDEVILLRSGGRGLQGRGAEPCPPKTKGSNEERKRRRGSEALRR